MIRQATETDRAFLIEMARRACVVEGRHPVPSADAEEVKEIAPGPGDLALVAVDERGEPIGAAWCFGTDPPLLLDPSGRPLPEMAVAVEPSARGKGVGAALIDEVAGAVSAHAEALTLNVHLLNPAVRLYVRAGFRVAQRGRGWYGVAMRRELGIGAEKP